VKLLPLQFSRNRGKFSTPPLYELAVVCTMPARNAALTVVALASWRLPMPLLALAESSHPLDSTVMASATSEEGLV